MEWVKLNQECRVKWQGMKLKETKEYTSLVIRKEKR